jgi:SSS family solute:Na+ symporter
VLYLGSTALDTIIGTGDGTLVMYSILGLALFAASYSLWGGLAAVAWTDVIQVALLITGGFIMTYLALDQVTPQGGIFNGLAYIYETAPEKFSMIISKGEIITPNNRDAWWDLPGLAVLIGGMWVANLYYWGFNQYIIQRTLAAKSLRESQRGIAFAAFLKLLIPLIVVIPGIIAYVMNIGPEGTVTMSSLDPSFINQEGTVVNDNAAPWLISNFIPNGLRGLVLAALAAAIVSSLASMVNSTSTIFTMDIYKPYINPKASETSIVMVGRITVAVALTIAVLIAPQLANLGQVFQYIQEYTGIVSPGILAVFLTGLFWRWATNNAAIWGVILSIPIAMYFKVGPNGWAEGSALEPLFISLPFLQQMLYTCLLTIGIIMLISRLENKGEPDEKGLKLTKGYFATGPAFNISATVIMLILAVLYAVFW